MAGEVIGIVSQNISKSGGSEGLGFVVTIDSAKILLVPRKVFWGALQGLFLTGDLAAIFNVPAPAGFLVKTVAQDSMAWNMGLQGGDRIVTIGGKEIPVGGDIILSVDDIPVVSEDNIEKIRNKLAGVAPGAPFKMSVLRAGKVIELTGTSDCSLGDRRAFRTALPHAGSLNAVTMSGSGVPIGNTRRHAERHQRLDVTRRNGAADDDPDAIGALSPQPLEHPSGQQQVRAGEDREPDDVHVLLDGLGHDLLRRALEAGVDDLHAGVAQGVGDDLGAAVVAVEPGLGDEDLHGFLPPAMSSVTSSA